MAMLDGVTAYYRTFLGMRPWYREGMSWTVIQPGGQAVTEDAVISRLRARRAVVATLNSPPFEKVAYLQQVGEAVVMYQPNGFEGARPEVLRWLSEDSRVHTVEWAINGNGSVSYAVHGKLLVCMDKNDPDRRWGAQPDLFDDEDLAELRAARRQHDAGETDRPDFEPMAMALVERRTGVRLELDWVESFNVDSVGIVIGDIPDDPRPSSALGKVDPDLDARLRSAPASVRHAAVLLVVQAMAERLTWHDPEAVAATVTAVQRGEPLDDEIRTRVFRCRATEDDVNGKGSSARHGLFMATTSPEEGDPLDAIQSATYALPGEWPALRREIDTLLRHGGCA
ncbi:DUF6461 domain-containing protein [Amycolatopsis taiwanensis]|uniref:Uncharacterized protein n=1 Tax=Amycolatopsis taiwanensis TaxID=342230 RepID=A0A9W6VFT8_9PSEU|nr:DUF6461 domain-containing protein [Amycolatopsis taiwanensis]GLY65214.1 hypothetical protein Atai01_18330 [Amycolatopsis taiwanensis]